MHCIIMAAKNFTFRLPEGLRKKVEEEITSSYEFSNMSDFILAAIRFYLDYRQSKGGGGNGN